MKLRSTAGNSTRVRQEINVLRWRITLVTCTALLAVLIILLSTRWGAALGDDSYSYIKPVRDALSGQSMEFHPSFPPFLPIILTGVGFLGIEPLEAIRYLNAILFGVTVLLAFLIVFELSGSFTFSLLASVAILISAGLIEVFASAMSEPLYMSLTLASIYTTARYTRDHRMAWLIAAAVSAGLALFTRYAGMAIIVSIAAFLLLKKNRSWRKRAKDTLLFLFISAIPIAGYIVRNLLILGRPIGQSRFSWSLVREFPLRLLIHNVYDWLIPGKLIAGFEEELTLLLLLLIFALFLGYWLAYRQRIIRLARDLRTSAHFVLLAIFIGVNLLLLSIARGFFAGGNPFNPRYLSPVQLAVLMIFFGFLGKLYPVTGRASHILISGACVGFFALLGLRATYTIQVLYREGSGYSSHRWHISETIAYLNHRPDTPVMSTAAAGVYFWTGRRPTNIPNSNSQVKEALCDTGGFLVVIDSMPLEFYGIDHAELTEGLTVEQDFSEGTIYRMDPINCE